MKSAKDYVELIDAEGLSSMQASAESIAEVKQMKREMILKQKRLMIIKKEIVAVQRGIRSEYSVRLSGAGSGGSFLLSMFGKRGLAGNWRAASKRDLRAERDIEIERYNIAKQYIDEVINKFDVAKLDCDRYILENKK